LPTLVSDAPDGPGRFAQRLFSDLPARYDVLADLLSFGQNARWRRSMVDRVVAGEPELVLDVATGPAGVALQVASRTGARVVGLDITPSMLDRARTNVARSGARVQLLLGRGEQLPFADGTFDAVTFTYLLRYVDDPAAAVRELARVVKPGGVLANQEFLVPPHPFWRFWWWLYTRAVLPAAGWLTGGRQWFDVGRFLGPNISAHYRRYPLSWTVRAWQDAGMVDVGTRAMSLGGGLVMWGRRSRG
jgi:demethylmenaquinone methyltransferase / 2-methoxy-6-polyprenyl-1,4-benzoquinol methylase